MLILVLKIYLTVFTHKICFRHESGNITWRGYASCYSIFRASKQIIPQKYTSSRDFSSSWLLWALLKAVADKQTLPPGTCYSQAFRFLASRQCSVKARKRFTLNLYIYRCLKTVLSKSVSPHSYVFSTPSVKSAQENWRAAKKWVPRSARVQPAGTPRKGTRTLQGWPVSETSCGPSCYSETKKPALFKISTWWHSVNLYKTMQKQQQRKVCFVIVTKQLLTFKESHKIKLPRSIGSVLSSCILASASCETQNLLP